MNSKTVLLLGSYGQTNLGDDLLMYNYLDFLKQRGINKIYVAANLERNVPAAVKTSFPDIMVVPTYKASLFSWIRILRQTSYVVYGGGTVFKELYASTGRGRHSLTARIVVFNLLARMLGARIYYMHIGIGVVKTGLGRAITRWALGQADLCIFRDDQSFLFAHDVLGLKIKKLCLATDGLFLNERWQKPWQPAELSLPKGKKVVGVNLLSDIPDWINRDEYIRSVKQFVVGLLDQGYFVLLVPFQHSFNTNNDYIFMKREFAGLLKRDKNIRLLKNLPIEQAVSLFKSLHAFVGMRFHSLLLAATSATPFAALAYDTKCWRLIEEIDYPHALRLEDVSASHLMAVFKRLISERSKVGPILKRITAEQFKQGQQCIDQLSF